MMKVLKIVYGRVFMCGDEVLIDGSVMFNIEEFEIIFIFWEWWLKFDFVFIGVDDEGIIIVIKKKKLYVDWKSVKLL